MTIEASKPEDITRHSVDTFSYWRAVMSRRFVPLEITALDNETDFTGSIVSREFADTHLSLISADAHKVRRTPESIRPEEERYVKLSLQIEGGSVYIQDGRSATITPGDLVIYDTSRPYTVESTGRTKSFIVMMHPIQFSLSSDDLEHLTALRISPTSVVGECASPFMNRFAKRFEVVSENDGLRLMKAFIGLVDAVLLTELPVLSDRETDFDRIRKYMEDNISDPELTITQIANDNFISVRSLQYLFQNRGSTVTEWLRSERLLRAQLDLANPALAHQTITQVATRWGFSSPVYFNRLFKRQFGRTPGEWKREALDSLSS